MSILTKFFHKLRKRPAAQQQDLLQQRYKAELLRVAGNILQDAKSGHVLFVLNDEQSQVHCTFQWFASVTNGGDAHRTITLRHALLVAMNILNVRTGQPYFSEETPMPLFVTLDGQPCMQYTFWGKTHVRCERYDQDVAEAMAACDEVKDDKRP